MSEQPTRADAHAHLFKPGWVHVLPENCRLTQPDEATVYDGLTKAHGIKYLLAVGYEGADWARGNNAFLAEMVKTKPWLKPVAFFPSPTDLSIDALESWARKKFVGASLYLSDEKLAGALKSVPAEVWQWFVQHRQVLSINSQGEHWRAWTSVLEKHPDLRVLVSHLGSPPAVEKTIDARTAAQSLASVIALAKYPGVRVKLSGFYALTKPEYDYPHTAAWLYVEALIENFGVDRLLWGSDFAPSIDYLSFPQTYGLFAKMPFLTPADRRKIEGQNLIDLLDACI
jgi:predicted TIM-barrel fold metal-dependent hydrolase